MVEVIVELGPEIRVVLGGVVSRLDLQDQRHQGFRDKPPAVQAEMAARIRSAAIGIGCLHYRPLARRRCTTETQRKTLLRASVVNQSVRATFRNSRILSGSLSPGRRSTPEDTSTALAPEAATASG